MDVFIKNTKCFFANIFQFFSFFYFEHFEFVTLNFFKFRNQTFSQCKQNHSSLENNQNSNKKKDIYQNTR